MQFNESIKYINEHATDYLKPDASKKGYICPICGSGSGAKGTGITENPKSPNHFTCWAGCFSSKSYIDILAIRDGINESDTKAVVENACRECGITLDENKDFMKNENKSKIEKAVEEKEADYKDFFKKCHADVNKTDYWQKRGLGEDVIERFNIGYCESWSHPKVPKAPKTARLIIPTGDGSYLARAVDESVDKRYSKQKVGNTKIFNISALENPSQPVFIVEGEIDAMSIIQVGGEAVGLGSLSMTEKLLDYVESVLPKQPLIFALDNDKGGSEAGNKAQKKIEERREQLEEKGLIIHFADVENLYSGHKDANEALCAEFFEFAPKVEEEKRLSYRSKELRQEALVAELRKDSVLHRMPDFMQCIEASKTRSYIPTGFPILDKELDGGLFPGLYIVGAISSLGKTTMCLQIADQIAQQGKDVLIFSLEMSRNELIAKSISRITSIEDVKLTRSNTNAKTTRGILTGSLYEKYNETEKKLIASATEIYKSFCDHLYVYEASEEITVQSIRKRVELHTKVTGEAPIVLIDYLQIIDPPKDQQFLTDKQVTDKNVKALKIISRDFNTTVIGISSFNRDNYTSVVNMASFKESGAIEYSSDVLIGLQYKDMAEAAGDKVKAQGVADKADEDAKNRMSVAVQLKILKNRNGSKGTVDFDFYPMFNKFKEKQQ